MFDNLGNQIYQAIVYSDRWQLYLQGLGSTFEITLMAVAIGLVIGIFVAVAKDSFKDVKGMKWLVVVLNVYTTIIRGTPMVVQLMIMYFIVFASSGADAIIIAGLAFGINSGAYVSEIVRAGINSIPKGQTEAGRSLGLSKGQTMNKIIMPQAIKNVLPALGNEIIVLFKETSIVGYIAIMDLTRAADLIRSRTFQPLVPLLLIAGIYLVIVLILTYFLGRLEKRMAASEQR